ncbi:acyltransferase family protein [Luteimonas kalidii]|uniref:Acyltransferase family protein n=1 Tax=Luteimonas kalidii TaxID=3042025 RepID=A0ABT6JXY7_9GAMM|nr:acyltransferase family protein [Luteimonas kalidii]MDH5835570.1 acyltransferase family protein [Luteimonas kalidii]
MSRPAGSQRDPRIDAIRALAIVLVMLGHARGIPETFQSLVFSFHVPLFFLLSGWLATAHGRARGDGTFVARQARGLLLPYLGFFLPAYGYWLATRNIGSKAQRWGEVPWWDPLQGALAGSGPGLYVQPALWFLPALFVTAVAYRLLVRRPHARWLAPVAAVVCCAWIEAVLPLPVRLPWSLDLLPVCFCFYAFGAALAVHGRSPATPLPAGIVWLVVAAWLPLAWFNGRVDINLMRFGASAFAFLAAALLGSLVASQLATRLHRWPAVAWIGRNTLLLLGIHFPVFFVLSGIRAVAGVESPPGPGWALFVTAVALLAAVPLRWLLLRLAPWVLGQPGRETANIGRASEAQTR